MPNGYWIGFSYMGKVNGDYMEFSSDAEYYEYLEEDDGNIL